ncbi:putative effector protein [Ceratobasidium theobromae]|uniref:Putative effector protein n=1 Tax=Ceratobasidium theobromae TaxID=1582974 RepID=A0A5N5QEZ5_9AGAM|nr:putative effector protein [Ceratobasidium theobromae]
MALRMFSTIRTLASLLTVALICSNVVAHPVGHQHEDNIALTTRADGTKVAVENLMIIANIVACMDPRIEMDFVLKQLNLTAPNSYIVRNAGGRASVIVSQEFLGTSEIYVIHHTDCGMGGQSEEGMRKQFYKADDLTRTFIVNQMEFLPIRTTNYTESVLDDVALFEFHPLVKPGSKVSGWIYNLGSYGNDSMTKVYP